MRDIVVVCPSRQWAVNKFTQFHKAFGPIIKSANSSQLLIRLNNGSTIKYLSKKSGQIAGVGCLVVSIDEFELALKEKLENMQ